MLMLMQQVEKYQLTPYLDSSTINILLFTHTDREGNIDIDVCMYVCVYIYIYIYMGNDHQGNWYDFPKYKNCLFS